MRRFTLDTRIDITAAGRVLLQTRRPMLRCQVCEKPVREAFDDETANEAITCAECDREIEEEQRPLLANPRFCPTICNLCNIGNIYGQPTCSDEDCPGKRQE